MPLFRIVFLALCCFSQSVIAQVRSELVLSGLSEYSPEMKLMDLRYSPDGQQIIVAYSDSIRVFDVGTRKCVLSFDFTRNSEYDAFGKGEPNFYLHKSQPWMTYVLCSALDIKGESYKDYSTFYFSVSLLTRDLKSGKIIQSTAIDTISQFSPDPTFQEGFFYKVLFNSDFGTFKVNDQLWSIEDGKTALKAMGGVPHSAEVIVREDGTLFSLTDDVTLQVQKDGKVLATHKIDSADQLFYLDRERFASCRDGVIKVYAFNKPQVIIEQVKVFDGNIGYLALDGKGELYCSASSNGFVKNIRLFNSDFKQNGELIINTEITSLFTAVQPGTNYRLCLTERENLTLFRVREKRNIPEFVPQVSHPNAPIDYLDFSSDGKYMVTRCQDAIVIWDVALKKVLYRFEQSGSWPIAFIGDSYDVYYKATIDNYILRWKSWESNYLDNLQLRSDSESETIDEPETEDTDLKKWLSRQKNLEENYRDQNAASSPSYFAGVFKKSDGFGSQIIVEARNGQRSIIKSDTLVPERRALRFYNDSILGIVGSYNVVLINVKNDMVVGVFNVDQKNKTQQGLTFNGVSGLGTTGQKIFTFSDSQVISEFDLKEVAMVDRIKDLSYYSQNENYFDVAKSYYTFPIAQQNASFQFVVNTDNGHQYMFFFAGVDTLIKTKDYTVQGFNITDHAVSCVKLAPDKPWVAVILTRFLEQFSAQNDFNPKREHRLVVIDFEKHQMVYTRALSPLLITPSMVFNPEGNRIVLWDYNASSDALLKQLKDVPGSKGSLYGKIDVIDWLKNEYSSLDLDDLEIKRLGSTVRFVPLKPDQLVILDNFQSEVKYISISKKKSLRTVTALTQKQKYGFSHLTEPIFPSLTGDTLYYTKGSKVDHYVHNRFRAIDIPRDEIILDITTDYRFRTAALTSDKKYLLFGHLYDVISVYEAQTGRLAGKFINSENSSVFLNADGYYKSESGVKDIYFRSQGELHPLEQFDLKFNRPDLVLQSIGYADSKSIETNYEAYEKRLSRLGFQPQQFEQELSTPELSITNKNEFGVFSGKANVTLKINAHDSLYDLDRINVWINDVPVYGKKGLSVAEINVRSLKLELPLTLAFGKNKIQVSCINSSGIESLKELISIDYLPKEQRKPDLYLITIGISQYANTDYNLRFASKDANDLKTLLNSNTSQLYRQVYSVTLTDQDVTPEKVKALKELLLKAERNDVVMVAYAGHGFLDQNYDYYLATYNVDHNEPAREGLPYASLEGLLDGILPLKKVLFIDACHSGEVDKTLITETTQKGVTYNRTGRGAEAEYISDSTKVNASELSRELFNDLRRETGTTIISASGGLEVAFEKDEYQNGLFTYCILMGLKENSADLNKDGKVMLSELQQYLQKEVYELSEGLQKPNNRLENLEMDWRVW